MTSLTVKRIEPIVFEIDRIILNGRARLGIEDLNIICRRNGILEAYQRKEAIRYLEAIGKVKIVGSMVQLIDKKKTETEVVKE